MLKEYVPVLLHALLAVGFASLALAISFMLGKKGRHNRTKDAPYECGVTSVDSKNCPPFAVKFYLVAMLFLLFDIEIIFLYPWAVVFQRFLNHFGPQLLWSCLSFVGILLVGFFYAVRKGALDWGRRMPLNTRQM
ncbi:MAG: NADH-quinone oxidoreductase subunit I [Verrucomicrobia bacterium]|nr:MAG: NADH-quinone oxidoreductase subunit I [Verrucomicrobiota bacterium]